LHPCWCLGCNCFHSGNQVQDDVRQAISQEGAGKSDRRNGDAAPGSKDRNIVDIVSDVTEKQNVVERRLDMNRAVEKGVIGILLDL
jgi:hypothetical protein